MTYLCAYSMKFTGLFFFFVCLCTQSSANGPVPGQIPTNTHSAKYDVYRQHLALDVNPENGYLKGELSIFFTYSEPGPNQIQFDLDDSLKVDSVVFHRNRIPFIHQNHHIQLSLDLVASDRDSLTVYYQGFPIKSRYRAYYVEKHGRDATLAPIVFTSSQPYGAQDWWPCQNNLSDKTDTFDILIQCPKAYTAVSNGKLMGIDSSRAGFKTFHWKHQYPIATYLLAFAITNYVIYTDTIQFKDGLKMPVDHFVYPEYLSTALTQTPELIPVFHLYDSLYGDYPFKHEKYGHAMYARGGGMENQTISFMSGFQYDLMTHELAHHWFGNKITCYSWQDIWLNEGFATFAEVRCRETLKPESANEIRSDIKNSVLKENTGSVFVDDTTRFDRIFNGRLSYAKGAMLLSMLRLIMGDSAFDTAIKQYISGNPMDYGFVSTLQLKHVLEQHYKGSLDHFFAAWFYGEGFPTYKISWQTSNALTRLDVQQISNNPSIGFFPGKIPLRFKGQNRDTLLLLSPDQADESFLVSVGFDIDEIQFDPEHRILGKAEILFQNAPGSGVRVYPNPAFNTLNINSNTLSLESIEVFDIGGKKVLELALNQTNPGNSIQISTAELQPGIYLYKCRTTSGSVHGKFVRLEDH